MQKWLRKILFFLAVVTVVSHNVLPHIHHQFQELGNYHEDHHDDDESIFSFVQLDEEFVPANSLVTVFELPIVYLLTSAIASLGELITPSSKAVSFYREYPPPNNYFTSLPSRAPPTFESAMHVV